MVFYKIFDSEGKVIEGSDDSSTVRGVRNIFKLAENKKDILNKIKNEIESTTVEQGSDIQEAA